MTKVAIDLLEFVRGSHEYMPLATGGEAWLYPMDLEFMLRDEARHFTPKDANGLPMKRYLSVGEQYNPTRMAGFAFAHWNRLRQGDESSRDPFMRAANWFRDTADRGRWLYHFDWAELKAPWISAMAQGDGINVLARATLLAGDAGYTAVAREALTYFERDVADGGVRGRLPDGSVFFEEYPTPRPVHVLGGYLFTLTGLIAYDHFDPSYGLKPTLDAARTMLERNLDHWEIGGWSTYDLHHLEGDLPNFCTALYHRLHATLLLHVGSELKSPIIVERSERWAQSGRKLTKRLRAAAGKIRYRLRHPAPR